ncbi:MAG: hypothetical protein QHH19_03155, partial [Candidatus Thermoplasmatota archaeon]|nr:hypothetical protein [Candidatus Thermoplasmatota archaeon]
HQFGLQIVRALRRSFSKNGKKIKAVLLDSGYLSWEMTDEIEKSNAKPYIKMKKNSRTLSKGSSSWGTEHPVPKETTTRVYERILLQGSD